MDKFESLFNAYIEDCEFRKRLNSKTLCAYSVDLKQFFEYAGAEFMNSEKINDYIHYLNRKCYKVKTVKRKIASLKAFFSYLEYIENIEVSPFRKVRTKIQEPKILPKTIDEKVLDQIFNYLYKSIEEAKTDYKINIAIRNATIIELLFCTGLRISELCELKINNINLLNGKMIIFGKGSKERILFIGNENVLNILNKYFILNSIEINKKGWLFPNKDGEKLSDQSIRKLLKNIEVKLNLTKHITPHMFRHTFATMLLDKDVDIRYIQKILGHSSISITQIYTHVSNSKQKEIMVNKNPRNDYSKYKINL